MRAKTQKKKPPLFDAVMQTQNRRAFFRLPECPQCGTQLRYGQTVARLPVFSIRCTHCGAGFYCRVGLRSVLLLLVLTALGCGLDALLYQVATDFVPVIVLTLLLVIGAYFLWPLTLTARKKKQK